MTEIRYSPDQVSILIVDDQDPIRKAMRNVIASMGFTNIVETSDANDAIAVLEKRPIDLVLCDLYLRKGSGFDVLQYTRSRAIGSDVPFILVTGEASKEDIVKGSDLGANEYILKPFQTDALEHKVIKVLNEFFSPSTLLMLLRNGDKQILKKDYEQAVETFRSALNLDSESQRAKHSLAVALLLMGHEKEAQKMLENNIKEAQSYYKNYVTLANLHLRRKNLPEAIKIIKTELELHPKQAARQALLAKLLLQQGDAEGAIDHFREALREDPKHEMSLLGMGHAFAKKADLEKSLYYFKRLRRHKPDSASPLLAAIKCCLEANEPKKVESMLRDEKQRYPERLDVYSILAKFYIAQGRNEDAVTVLNELFARQPEDPDGLKVKGGLEMKLKNYSEAAITFTRLTKVAPSVESFLACAECFERTGKHRDAIATLTRCLILENRNAQVVFRLAVSFLNTKQLLKAHATFLRARTLGWDKTESAKYLDICLQSIKARRADPNLIAS